MDSINSTNSQFMRRCLVLARYADGKTAPNPMVGSVIVFNDEIIGEGYHNAYGEPHAEVNAINAVKNKELLPKSTLYVNIEPCSHYGKTPPCADLIINCEIPKVVIGMADPNPKVNGKGIEKLQKAGIEVVTGVLEDECKNLNRRFITFIEKKRPYIILKWAETADHYIDLIRENSKTPPLKISNSITKTLNHQIRTQEASILVGTNTALLDNPHLTVRKWSGKNPVRMVIDKNLKIPKNYNIFDNSTKTLIFNNLNNKTEENTEFIKLNFAENIIPQILNELHKRQLQSVIVEGGKTLLQSFINLNLWDECHIEQSEQIVKNGVPAPILTNHRLIDSQIIKQNRYFTYENVDFK